MSWFGLVRSGLWRRPGRTLLTTFSVASAFLLIGLFGPVLMVFEGRGETSEGNRLIVQPRHSTTDFLPVNHAMVISKLPGVRDVSYQTWFGGTFRDGENSFARWAVPDSFFPLHPEIIVSPDTLELMATTRTGAIVGRRTAELFGLKVGDRVALVPDIWSNKDMNAWEFDVVGIFDGGNSSVDLTAMYINYAFFDEYRAWGTGLVSYINADVDVGHSAGEIVDRIDSSFANSSDETNTSTERDFALGFAQQLGDIGLMISVILGSVLFTMALVTANTIAHGMHERMAEFAVLRAMGFQRLATQALVAGESLALVLLGAVPGLIGSALLLGLGRDFVPQLAGITIGFPTLAAAAGIVLCIGLLAACHPVLRLKRLKLVDELRKL